MKDLYGSTFVLIDVETTGLYPQSGDRVVEIAALKVKDFDIQDKFETFVDPKRILSWGAFQVNGITPAMLKNAPEAKMVLPKLLSFVEGACLIGHHVKFDLGFLNNELELAKLPLITNPLTIDTVKMARGLLPELGRYNLASVAYALGIKEQQKHRAMSDIMITYQVFKQLCAVAQRKDVCDLNALVNLFGVHKLSDNRNMQKLELIEEAIQGKVKLDLFYFAAHGGTTSRQVTPIRLQGEGSEVSLIAFCHMRRAEREFKLNRILECKKAE